MVDSEDKDISWKQRFVNFNKAFSQFEKFLEKEETIYTVNDLKEKYK